MADGTNHIGQSYVIGEAALIGIGEFAAQNALQTNAEINLVGYRQALTISCQLTKLENKHQEFISTLHFLDEAIRADIAATPSPIQTLIDRLDLLTEQITKNKAVSQRR